ncbi:TetR/AcrR family transcriptional regulator [Actinocrispum wychmicini]|uniref:TetR family transcriptional regulator n=1 Tax=Actinocrispum wychmicini TaxID=1213861 RepID=A0A4R2JB40_9PSEU|nr:TetR/AcrR family transcriptional regulator [Actinocrispum wychmicini]TCO56034.1 TetR family transcriptional regulator [Actinocrispum wychmicini]
MTRTRLTAAERSEQLVSAAITAFSVAGYAGTTTDDVARLADVSQPYVIRLFGSKRQLFIAGMERATDRIEEAFRAAGTDLAGLGSAYDQLLAERELLSMLLHGFAASSDPVIGAVVRDRFGRIYRLVKELTGVTVEQARDFVATGMLLTVLGSLRVLGPDAVPAEPWMTELTGSIWDSPTDPQD